MANFDHATSRTLLGSQRGIANASSKWDGHEDKVKEFFMRGFMAKGLMWAVVESGFDAPNHGGGEAIQPSVFGYVLSDEAVGVFVTRPLSGFAGVGKEDVGA